MSLPALNAVVLFLVMLLSTVLGGPVAFGASADASTWGTSAEPPQRTTGLRGGELKPVGAERRAVKPASVKKGDGAPPPDASPRVLVAGPQVAPVARTRHRLPAPLPGAYQARAPPSAAA